MGSRMGVQGVKVSGDRGIYLGNRGGWGQVRLGRLKARDVDKFIQRRPVVYVDDAVLSSFLFFSSPSLFCDGGHLLSDPHSSSPATCPKRAKP